MKILGFLGILLWHFPGLESLEKFSGYVAGLVECWKSGIHFTLVQVIKSPSAVILINLKTNLFLWFGLFSTQTELFVTTVMCACAVLGERVSIGDKYDTFSGRKRRFQICLESKVIPCVRESSCLWESRSFYVIM